MKQSTKIFLQVFIVIIGIGALAFLLWEPHIEGRNANASLFEIYFTDPFLAYAYIASLPFFIALYQAFAILRRAGQNKTFFQETIKSVRTIKYCALSIIVFVAGGEIFILLNHGSDDPAGGVFMGILIAFGSVVIAAAAGRFEKILHNEIEKKL